MKLLNVNYHYIRKIKKNNGIFAINPNQFKKQIENLGRYYDFININQLEKIKSTSNKNICLLTFDDNLMEQNIAFEYLDKNKIPFISFCSSYPYLEKKVLNVHKLHLIFYKISLDQIQDEIIVRYNFDIKNNISEKTVKKVYSYGDIELNKIKYFLNFICDENIKNKIIDFFFREIISDEEKFIKKHYYSTNLIKHLSKKNMIGSHSHSHRPLAKIKNFKKDILMAHNFFKNVTNSEMKYFSYPYGRVGSYNFKVCNFLKKLKYKFAFTMNRGFVENLNKNPLLLNRIDTNDAPLGKLKKKEYYP
jgi:peptidoglycan/xylan/chitin deacetylase (PgdA/CDA1 family)